MDEHSRSQLRIEEQRSTPKWSVMALAVAPVYRTHHAALAVQGMEGA